MQSSRIPPFVGEDHVCVPCGLSYVELCIADAYELIRRVPDRSRTVARAVSTAGWRQRPSPGRWSPLEYLCHLRDVTVTYTIRLHRARTEDRPRLEPMLNELRTRRFRYQLHDPAAVLAELDLTTPGLLEEADQFDPHDWDRLAARLPGEHRTARWLLRQAAHEGVHHLRDIESLSSAGQPAGADPDAHLG